MLLSSSGQKKLLVLLCSRYYISRQAVWTTTSYNYGMWTECLDYWDQVTVAAPCLYQDPPKQATRADGPGVRFAPLANSFGALASLQVAPKRFSLLHRQVCEHDALVLHMPDVMGPLAYFSARRFDKPCGLDVRGSQATNARYLRLRGVRGARLIAVAFSLVFRWVRAGAAAAVYVSRDLKDQFPLPARRPTWVCSDIRLPEWWFTEARSFSHHQGPWRICSVGRLEVGKRHSLLLEACAELVHRLGRCFVVDLIGDGPLEKDLRDRATSLGIADLITFHGFVPWGPLLHRYLLQSDLFVLSSITEGMPRVLLEAMACGLPVVATAVGGISEILAAQDIVPHSNVPALTAKLTEVLSQPDRMSEMSQRNYEKSEGFQSSKLRAKKQAFYRYLRQLVESRQEFRS
jgi:glycosyltransferase involved in cell wall biosynthesis